MAKNSVVWSDSALSDLSELGSFIGQDSPERAVSFTNRLFEATVALETFPFGGVICPEDSSCRQLTLEGYRIIYEVSATGTKVLRIISPGRDAIRLISSKN